MTNTTRIEYSAEFGQLEHDIRGTAKGPGLKIGKNHKSVEHLEKPLLNMVNRRI